MAEDNLPTVEQDIATLTGWLDDPQALRDLVDDHDFLRDEADARDLVTRMLQSLDDALHGRTHSHEEVMALLDQQRRDAYPAAAE